MFALLKRNLVPIIFFAFVGVGVISFLDYRTEEQEKVRELILTRRAGTVAVQEEIREISNLSLVAEASEEDYRQILRGFEALNQAVVTAQEELPRENKSPEYTEYVEAAEEYFGEYLQSSEEVQRLFESKYSILPFLEEFSQDSEIRSVDEAREHLAVVEYLVEKSGAKKKTNFTVRVQTILQEILEDGMLDNSEQERYRELRAEESFFVAPGLHLIRFTDIDDADVLDKFEKMDQLERFLRAQYELVELDGEEE